MSPDDAGLRACDLLAQASKQVYLFVLLNSIKQRERISGEVATKLGRIAQESFLDYEMDDEIEDIAAHLLRGILQFCKYPNLINYRLPPNKTFSCITEILGSGLEERLSQSVSGFFEIASYTKELNDHCDAFLAKLDQGRPSEIPTSDRTKVGTKVPAPTQYPRHVSENLFNILYRHASCQPLGSDLGTDVRSAGVDGCSHPARLFLDAASPIQRGRAKFEVVVSTTSMDYWQDFWIGIPTHIQTQRRMVGFIDEEESEDEDLVLQSRSRVDPNYFCQVLEQPLFAKLRVQYVHEIGLIPLPPPAPLERFLCAGQGLPLCKAVQEFTLTDKHKVLLAHAVAHSFWQFYGSDMMREKWTSQNIWFMFENDQTEEPDDRQTAKDRLALRPYMAFHFDGEDRLSESLDNPIITHPFPHILALGIVLLEIGLSRPFRRMNHLPLASRLNWEHGAANQLLGELERIDWVRPTQKEVFTKVVASCLDPGIFATVPGPRSKTAKSSRTAAKTIKTPYSNSGEAQIDERRRRLYRHTVEPLARLVKIAFKQDPHYVSYLSRRRDVELLDRNLLPQIASFPIASKTIVAREWLDNLKHISAHVKLLQRQIPGQVWEPVKIAILDTGYDNTLPFFKQVNRKACIGGWKDFVGEDGIKDDYGHGSLMARLVMESAPLARVHIARIAMNTDETSFDADRVAMAIRWACLEEMVDIVFMSFGFPDYDEKIAGAIEDVTSQRNIIFLASAGNNAKYQNETFPARHRHVISIRATNFAGSFSENNPPVDDDCITPAFGTFGGDLSRNIVDEISRRFGPNICQPGSSIATAVAAGIAASTISYAEVLLYILRIPSTENPVQCLKTTEGMRKMLKKMSPDQKGTTRFVNPIWFWSEETGPWKAWAAICNSVSKLMRQHK